jgi:hypothetical protein
LAAVAEAQGLGNGTAKLGKYQMNMTVEQK